MIISTIQASNCTPQTIVIGRRGTYDTMQIAFDLSYLIESYGSGTAVLAVKRSQDESAYPAVVTQEDNILTWTVSETDTAYVGSGECQLMWYIYGGLAKTIIYPMVVMRDILQTTEEPPDGYENWIEHLTELGAETQQNAQDAKQSASEAKASEDSAAKSAQRAEDAAGMLVDVSATATTLEPVQPATAEYDEGVFKFGIPKGDKLTYADLTEADKEDLVQGPIKDAQDDAVEAVGTAKNNAVDAVNQAGTTQKNAVNQAGTTAVNAVGREGTTQVERVTTEGNTQVGRVQDKGDEVIASIPSDYSDLTTEVDDLTRQLSDVEENQIPELKSAFDDVESKINLIGYVIGDTASIQRVNNVTNFTLDNPYERMLVESTDAPIFTGTKNFIDLLNIKQGSFTDTRSGITIEVNGNEVHIHGDAATGFRYDFQKGIFFTDSFTNHPANIDILPACTNGYRFCFWQKSEYTMPSDIYIIVRNQSGTDTDVVGLNAKAITFFKNSTPIAIYTNGAKSGIDVKFTLGLTIYGMPDESIESIAKMDYHTDSITKPGAYILGPLTWTGDNTTCSVKQLLRENVLTNNHIFAWFGDSISQLRDLPLRVSRLIDAKVYDCSFAGAPLTYSDTNYQPTGFMSLCSQIANGDFSSLSSALDAQELAGVNVTEKRQHLATLQSLDFEDITDVVVLAGTNDFDNDYVNATNFVNGFSNAITTLLTAYPHIIIHVLSPIWRGDKSEGVATIPTMEDIVRLEKDVAENYNLPFADMYRTSGINSLTATVFLEGDLLHLSEDGDKMLATKCAKVLLSN